MKFVPAAAVGLMLLSRAAIAGAPQGTWLSQDGGTKVRLTDCGGKLCGTLVWLNEPIDPNTSKPKTDIHNPDPAKRARPLIGLRVANGLAPSGQNHWSGRIYNADDGRTYQASFWVQSESTAKVQGCVLKVLCKGHTWTRSN
jgi:uncharacterized protein (DUF2147 family)